MPVLWRSKLFRVLSDFHPKFRQHLSKAALMSHLSPRRAHKIFRTSHSVDVKPEIRFSPPKQDFFIFQQSAMCFGAVVTFSVNCTFNQRPKIYDFLLQLIQFF